MKEQDFLEAYDEYADAIFRHCALRLGDREVGKDLMQDTYLHAWEAIAGGVTVENMRAYLYRIANNLITDFARRRKRRPESSLEEMAEDGFDPPSREEGPARTYEGKMVIETLRQVEEPYRTAVVLHYIDGLPPREIASFLGVSANVISVRLHRGMEKLRTILHAHG